VTRQTDGGWLRALYISVKEQRVQPGHVYELFFTVPTPSGKIQIALPKRVLVEGEARATVRRILFVNLGDVIERKF
jgi:hypothetical protein